MAMMDVRGRRIEVGAEVAWVSIGPDRRLRTGRVLRYTPGGKPVIRPDMPMYRFGSHRRIVVVRKTSSIAVLCE